ncbi:MAG: FxLYD domain-containing protein [Hyphomicrobiales bacterium]|nr:FxLYD domain-containing protein [Hyphomicrobiales bacterium]
MLQLSAIPEDWAVDQGAAPERGERRAGLRNRLAMVTAAAVFVMAAVGLRAPIVRIAPAAAVLFDAVGLHVNPVGLEITRVAARAGTTGDRRVLIVEGQIANNGERTRLAPAMRVSVRAADGQQLYAWTTQATRQRIEPGETAAFAARLVSPPADGADVAVEFEAPAAEVRDPAKPAASRAGQGSRTESQYR